MSKKKNKKVAKKPAKLTDKFAIEKGYCKCCVCGEIFKLHAKDRVTVRAPHTILSTMTPQEYDAWNCPSCGAQNRLNEHYEEIKGE